MMLAMAAAPLLIPEPEGLAFTCEPGWFPSVLPSAGLRDEATTLFCALSASEWAWGLLMTTQAWTHQGSGIRLAICPALAGLQTARASHPSLGSAPDLSNLGSLSVLPSSYPNPKHSF